MTTAAQQWLNPAIAQGREAALAILKPTPAQLEHGLELHRQAIVIDTYGFSAAATPDFALLRQAQAQNADPRELQRLYVRGMMTRMADDPQQKAYFAEAWQAAGVTCVFRNSGEEGNHMPRMLERLAYNTYVTDRLGDLMLRATTPADIQRAKREGKFCFYYTTNGVPLPLEFLNPAEEMRQLEQFFMLGVRMMHLTYNRRNVIGDGCGESQDGGLSDFGREVVQQMNRVGLIVDGAHSSLQTCRDACAVSSKPVVVSHSACASVNRHIRGKTDDVLKAVAHSGGYTGIACYPSFLGGSGDIQALLDHVMHAVKVVGAEHVTFGTDVASRPPTSDGESFAIPAMRRIFESHWPANDAIFNSHWHQPHMVQSLVWTNFPLFTVGLVQRGLSDQQILSILGGNALRVAKAVLER